MLLCFPVRNTHTADFKLQLWCCGVQVAICKAAGWGKCERKCLLSPMQLQDSPLICTPLCFLHLSLVLRNDCANREAASRKHSAMGDSNVLFMVVCLMDERRSNAWILPVNLGFLCGMTEGTSHIKSKKTIIKSATTGASGWYSLEFSLSSATKLEQLTQARGQH